MDIFPKLGKSKIKMIYKSSNPKTEINSFRPISLLSCITKWLEKIINKIIKARKKIWEEKNLLLPNTQSVFRKNRSCQDHILRFCQNITEGFNKREKTVAVFFDLEKSF